WNAPVSGFGWTIAEFQKFLITHDYYTMTTFPHREFSRAGLPMRGSSLNRREIPRCPQSTARSLREACTEIRHAPVNELHSGDSQEDKNAAFRLTLKIEGVKTTSFFDTF